MRAVRSRDTGPELVVRGILTRIGFRYRLHRQDLPGRPDVSNRKLGVAILVHGCFWHRHPGCRFASFPKTNKPFWRQKFRSNVARDARDIRRLEQLGFRVIVVWGCETKAPFMLEDRMREALQEW